MSSLCQFQPSVQGAFVALLFKLNSCALCGQSLIQYSQSWIALWYDGVLFNNGVLFFLSFCLACWHSCLSFTLTVFSLLPFMNG